MSNAPPTIVIVAETKSMVLAFLLTFLFGPVGMIYATVTGGLTMLVLGLILGFFTAGLALIPLWPICIIWTMMAVSSHNKRIHQHTAAIAGTPLRAGGVTSGSGVLPKS